MKIKIVIGWFFSSMLLAASSFTALAAESPGGSKQNELSAPERAAGWKLLFDGKSLTGWHGFKKKEAPKQGWAIEGDWLRCVPNGHGGDLVSSDEFNDFELSWEWRVPAKANNGLKYFITETRGSAIGHEYQMIDDSLVKNHPISSTASFYDVLPPAADKPLKPPGEINHSRVLVQGNHVEHWLNGAKVLEYELGSDVVKAAVAKSKFKDVAGFGTKIKGHILLTEHHDEAFFRNVKIRELGVN